MHAVIAGASGLIGTALTDSLRADGHRVTRLVRRDARAADESPWDPAEGRLDEDVIASADAVVCLSGASIGDKRLTDSYAKVVLQSRLQTAGLLARTIAATGVKRYLQASSLGYYGARGEERLHERSRPGNGLLADITVQWEQAANPAVLAGAQVQWLRTGLVLAPHGGFAERLLPLIRCGLVRTLGPGRQWHSWITLHDEVRAIRALLESSHEGPANLCSPAPARDREMIRALAQAAGRWRLIPVPAWAMRLAAGPAAEDLLGSQHVTPEALAGAGFSWDHPDIDAAAAWVMAGAAPARPSSPAPPST